MGEGHDLKLNMNDLGWEFQNPVKGKAHTTKRPKEGESTTSAATADEEKSVGGDVRGIIGIATRESSKMQ